MNCNVWQPLCDNLCGKRERVGVVLGSLEGPLVMGRLLAQGGMQASLFLLQLVDLLLKLRVYV